MGQYYKPVNPLNMEHVRSWTYDNGAKLMEHSWVGNRFVGVVMNLLKPEGRWFKAPLVWCGDYYDNEGETPFFSMVTDDSELKGLSPMSEQEQRDSIIVNYTRKEYVVVFKSPVSEIEDKFTWNIHPLPLLTACGNNRGGGDYRENCPDFDKVGIWANDSIGILDHIPYGFWELVVGFKES